MSPSQEFTLSRQRAADLLKISIRTLDRYIRRDYFNTKRIGRSVWISTPSFEQYVGQKIESLEGIEVSESDLSETETTPIPVGTSTHATGEAFESTQGPMEYSQGGAFSSERIELTAHEHPYNLTPTHIYKSLYDELKEQYDEQVKRLEGAHYKVGQLEAQVKSMVPSLEFNKQKKQLLLMDQQYKEAVDEANMKLKRSKKIFESERLNKNIYIAVVYALLALQVTFWALMSH
ncbi:MAG: hypothetical protein Q8P27_01960 [Candidatus Peregrinibacteria bacterium]|nr:hypothetical protein [Candidatus Peregrinibacteria bacterium]